MTTPKLAIVTMVYNEPDYLRLWLKYYARQVGPEHCYVVDHGSDDGSTEALGRVNVLRIPRSPQDDTRRTTFISEFSSSLLLWYDCVIYVDSDEFIVPDPTYFSDLTDYCAATDHPVTSAIGLNVLHIIDDEPVLRDDAPVLRQRQWAFKSSSMCKPSLIRRPVVWSPGFHSADAPAVFDRLYLFHLRWYDFPTAIRRLQKTRTMPWQDPKAGGHQKLSDQGMREQFDAFGKLPRREDDLVQEAPPIATFINQVLASQVGRERDLYRISLDIWPDELWRIPERFQNAF